MTHHTRFGRVARFRRGYRPRQVDHFLDRVETAMTGQGIVAEVTAAEVRRVGFDLVRHGYDARDVDAALEHLELRVLAHEAAPVGRRGQVDPFREAAYLSQELGHPYGHRFPRAKRLRRGYDVDDVDDFVDLVLATLQGSYRLTHEEVRSAVFAARRHGYDEDAVDEVLDRVIEFLLQPGTEDVLPSPPDPLEAPYLPAAGVAGAAQPSLAQRLRDPAGPPDDHGTDPEPTEPWSPFAPES